MTINLIPEKLKKERKIGQYLDVVRSVINLIALMGILFCIGLFLTSQRFNREIDATEKIKGDQQAKLLVLKDIEQQVELSNSKLSKLKTLKDSAKNSFSNILIELSNDTPTNVKINALNISGEGKLNISGEAETRAEIAKYKEKLEKSTFFKETKFSSSTLNEASQNYSFSLSCELE